MMHRMMSSLLCGVLLAAMLSGLSAWAAGEVEYTIDALDMSVSIPSDYTVFTRETDAGDPALRAQGLTKDKLLSNLEELNMYLSGKTQDESRKLNITMNSDNPLSDFSLCSDTVLSAISSMLETQYVEELNATIIRNEIYHHSQTKFLKIHFTYSEGDSTQYVLQYHTAYSGKYIIITMLFSTDPTAADEAELKGIIDSVTFDPPPQTALPVFTPAAAFAYTDAETKTTFTVPANWVEEPPDTSENPQDNQTLFTSLEETGLNIQYSCTDIWSALPESERRSYSRADFDKYPFSADIAKSLNLSPEEISLVTYGGKEFYKATTLPYKEEYGLPFSTPMTHMVCINNGYMYWFAFGGADDNPYYSDFETLLSSMKFKNEGIPVSPVNLFLTILLTIVLYALPVVLYRYAAKRVPVEKSQAIAITIVYSICALILTDFIVSPIGEKFASAGVILLWSVVNYFMLVCGKKPESRAEEVSLEQAEPALCTGESLDAPAPDEASAAAPIPIGSAESAAEPVPDECGSEPEPEASNQSGTNHYDQYATPLLFHKFFWYISLPLSFIGGAIQLFSIITGPIFGWASLPDVICTLIAMTLAARCFVGFFRWKAYAWYSVIIFLSLNVAYRLIAVILSILFTPLRLGTQLGSFVGTLIYSILVGLYYIKRRELFFLS